MSKGSRSCAFCGGGPLTREHVFPRWLVPAIEKLGKPRSATHVTQGPDHVHNVWGTETIDLKVRKVCGPCNSGWMSEMEVKTRYTLTPLVLSTKPQTFTETDAVILATWVAKTALTASLLYPNDTNPIQKKYFEEMFRDRAPFRNSVVWIAAYDKEGSRPCQVSRRGLIYLGLDVHRDSISAAILTSCAAATLGGRLARPCNRAELRRRPFVGGRQLLQVLHDHL